MSVHHIKVTYQLRRLFQPLGGGVSITLLSTTTPPAPPEGSQGQPEKCVSPCALPSNVPRNLHNTRTIQSQLPGSWQHPASLKSGATVSPPVVLLDVQQQSYSPLRTPAEPAPGRLTGHHHTSLPLCRCTEVQTMLYRDVSYDSFTASTNLRLLKGGGVSSPPLGTDLFNCLSNFHHSCERLCIVEGMWIHRIEETAGDRSTKEPALAHHSNDGVAPVV